MKVYGYIRVSSSGQADKDGPVRQQLAINTFAKAHGLQVVGTFDELGVSGIIEGLDRPGFIAMITRAEQYGVEAVVVERMDRLARDLFVSEVIIRELRKRNLKLFCTDQGLTDMVFAEGDPTRTMLRQIVGAVSQFDKTSIVIKMRAARERKRMETGRCEGDKPYGEKPAERQGLERILDLHEQGQGYGTIAKLLTFGGVRRRHGSTVWKKKHVYEIIARHKRQQKRKGVFDEQRSTKEMQEA